MVVDDLVFRHSPRFQALEILHEIADSEVRGVALAVVAVLFASLESTHVGRGHRTGLVAEAFERAMHQLFVLPGEAAEKQRGGGALAGGERLLDWPFKVVPLVFVEARFLFQTRAFFRKSLLNRIFDGGADLHEIGWWHSFRFKGLSAHSCASFPE